MIIGEVPASMDLQSESAAIYVLVGYFTDDDSGDDDLDHIAFDFDESNGDGAGADGYGFMTGGR